MWGASFMDWRMVHFTLFNLCYHLLPVLSVCVFFITDNCCFLPSPAISIGIEDVNMRLWEEESSLLKSGNILSK